MYIIPTTSVSVRNFRDIPAYQRSIDVRLERTESLWRFTDLSPLSSKGFCSFDSSGIGCRRTVSLRRYRCISVLVADRLVAVD